MPTGPRGMPPLGEGGGPAHGFDEVTKAMLASQVTPWRRARGWPATCVSGVALVPGTAFVELVVPSFVGAPYYGASMTSHSVRSRRARPSGTGLLRGANGRDRAGPPAGAARRAPHRHGRHADRGNSRIPG